MAITKTPRIYDQNKEETSLITTEQSEQEASPIATSTTDDEEAVEIPPVPSSPLKIGNQRISKSLDIKADQMRRALGTFKRFHSEETLKGRELIRGPESKSHDLSINKQKESKKARGRPRKETSTATSKPDAAKNETASKPSTRSRDKAIEPRTQTSEANISSQKDLSRQTKCPSGSSLIVKKISPNQTNSIESIESNLPSRRAMSKGGRYVTAVTILRLFPSRI